MSYPAEITADAGSRGPFSVTLNAEAISVRGESTDRTFGRADLPGNLVFSGLVGFWPHLVLLTPKALALRVSRSAADVILAWLGTPSTAQLEFEVHRRFRSLIPLGAVFLLFDLPIGERGFYWFGLLQTTLLLAIGIASYVAPRRYLFLMDGAWFLLMSAWWLLGILAGARSPWLLLWLPLNFIAIRNGIRLFRLFGSSAPA